MRRRVHRWIQRLVLARHCSSVVDGGREGARLGGEVKSGVSRVLRVLQLDISMIVLEVSSGIVIAPYVSIHGVSGGIFFASSISVNGVASGVIVEIILRGDGDMARQ